MIGFPQKSKKENFPTKCFWTKEKEIWVKFNPGLSADRPSHKWAQEDNTMTHEYQWMCLSLGQSWQVTWLKKDCESVPSTTGTANDVLCHGNSKTLHSLVVASASFHNGIRQIPRVYKLLKKWKHPKTFKIFKAILVWRTIVVVSPKAGIFDCPTKNTVQQRCSAWQSSLQEAFWSYQGEITSAQVLGDFDKSQPSVIQSDASKNG